MEVDDLLPFVIFFVFVLIISSIYSRKRKALEKSVSLNDLLDQIRREIVSATGSDIPGKNISEVIGVVRGVSNTQATSKEEFELSEKEALYNMLYEAKSLGANAVVEVRLNTGTYQQQGSKWQVSQAVYTGTAVKI